MIVADSTTWISIVGLVVGTIGCVAGLSVILWDQRRRRSTFSERLQRRLDEDKVILARLRRNDDDE